MRFQFEQTVPLPRSVVFAFHENPEHLIALHRGWAAFRLIEHQGNLFPGSRIWFETDIGRFLPVALGFEFTVYEPPQRYSEQLIHGPFRSFTHLHEFNEFNGSTVVRDVLEIELPWYYGGELAMRVIVAPIIQQAFKLRGEALLKWAQNGNDVPM